MSRGPSTTTATFRVSPENASFFVDEQAGDVLLHTNFSDARVLMGNTSNAVSMLAIGSNRVVVGGGLSATNLSTNSISSTGLVLSMSDPTTTPSGEYHMYGTGAALFGSNVAVAASNRAFGISGVSDYSCNLAVAASNKAFGVADFSSNLSVAGDTTVASNLLVAGGLSVGGILSQSNVAYFASNVRVLGSLEVDSVTYNYSNVVVFNNEEVRCNLVVSGTLATSNAATFVGSTCTYGVAQSSNVALFSSNVCVGGWVSIGGSNPPPYPMSVMSTGANNVSVFATGDISGLSDRRVKTDLVRIPDALAKVGRISGYTYVGTAPSDGPGRRCGLVAQELIEVLPEAVHANPETGLYSVAYGNVSSLLVESIKDLDAKIDASSVAAASASAASHESRLVAVPAASIGPVSSHVAVQDVAVPDAGVYLLNLRSHVRPVQAEVFVAVHYTFDCGEAGRFSRSVFCTEEGAHDLDVVVRFEKAGGTVAVSARVQSGAACEFNSGSDRDSLRITKL
jgi:hypothetical protein